MKHVVLTNVSRPECLDVLITPGITTADIFTAMKLTGYVLFPLSNPDKPFTKKQDLYPKVSNGEDLCLINSMTYYLYIKTPKTKSITSADNKPSKPLLVSEKSRQRLLKRVDEADAYIRSFFINEEEPPQETACGEEANDYSVSYDTKR